MFFSLWFIKPCAYKKHRDKRKMDVRYIPLTNRVRGPYYILFDWVGGLDGKIFGPRSWSTDRAQRGQCTMTECQIFSRLARPNSVNKHFIIWPSRFSFFPFFFCFFFFFSGNKIRNVHLRRSFLPKSRDLYSNKVVLVRFSRALLIKSPYEGRIS